jgi:hypothetical protein
MRILNAVLNRSCTRLSLYANPCSSHNNLKMDSKKTQDMAIAEQRLRYTALFGKPPTKRLENNPRWLATQIENHAVIHEIAGLRKE